MDKQSKTSLDIILDTLQALPPNLEEDMCESLMAKISGYVDSGENSERAGLVDALLNNRDAVSGLCRLLYQTAHHDLDPDRLIDRLDYALDAHADFCGDVPEDEEPDFVSALDWMSDTLRSLGSHLEGHHELMTATLFLDTDTQSATGGIGAQVQFSSPPAHPDTHGKTKSLWDREIFSDWRRADVLIAMLGVWAPTVRMDVRKLPAPTVDAKHPMARYFPARFRAERKYARKLLKESPPGAGQGLLTPEFVNRLTDAIDRDYSESLSECPLRQADPHGMRTMNAEVSLFADHYAFVGAGGHIFDLPGSLVEMFRKTNADDIPLDMVATPFSALYIHFGPQHDLDLKPGWPISGCYVLSPPDQEMLQIRFVTSPPEHEVPGYWPIHAEPYAWHSFAGETLHKDAGAALDEVIAAESESLRQQIKQSPQRQEEIRTELKEGGFPDNTARWTAAERAEHELVEKEARYPIEVKALRLALNALCYLTMYPEDRQPVWPRETPTNLMKKMREGTQKSAEKAKSKLRSEGYAPIHFCGQEIQMKAAAGLAEYSDADEIGVRQHWRRGHWRRQAYGHGLSQRKLVWVMPTLVGQKNSTEPDSESEILSNLYLIS